MTSLLLLATPFLIQARMPLALLATWAHCWLMFSCCHQCPQALSSHIQPITLQGVIVAKMQDSALGLIKLHPIGLHPSNHSRSLCRVILPSSRSTHTPTLVSSANLLMNNSNTLIHVVNKNIEQNWPQHRPLRDSTGDWTQLHAAPVTTTLWAKPSNQFLTQRRVLLSKPQAASFSRSVLWESIKGLAGVQVDNIHSLSYIHSGGSGSHKRRPGWSNTTYHS
ncbi:hypothetical protein DUI87_13087 [Hirundo rustica rustica]|uniref:Secreted protein n=1 Tax=Hirundo rustica rustica TaxID=333673 RepID=A0A3M0KB30_HIRRU|nr:hypothetical protein DUI87_13087 [Hirundo rustica rustica]